MLVLTRLEEESIDLIITKENFEKEGVDAINIKVIVVGFPARHKVRLGLQAPESVNIWRTEIRPDDDDEVVALEQTSETEPTPPTETVELPPGGIA